MSYESEDKMVSHPSHYKFGNFEVIDVVDAVTEELSGYECNYTAQALQYLMRWHRKNGDQDLEKAIWFIQRILDKHKEEAREIDVKNDKTLYSLREEGEKCTINNTCGKCKYFKMKFPKVNIGECAFSGNDGYEIMPSHEPCPEWRCIPEPSIDDETEPLGLRQNAAGVYIPKDTSKSE